MKALCISAFLSVTLSIAAIYIFGSTSGQQQLLRYVGLSQAFTTQEEPPASNKENSQRSARSE